MRRRDLLGLIVASARDPERIGDVPALKSELMGTRASQHVEALLEPVRGYNPPLDIAALSALPADTFGHRYATFLCANGLSPLVLTGHVPVEVVRRNAFVVRYGIIHDMVHTLTGFDASWPGEVGVWAFIGAQGYSRSFAVAGFMALCVAPLRAPLQLGRCWRAWRKGRQMGQRAQRLLLLRLEDHLASPLDQVREALGIQPLTGVA